MPAENHTTLTPDTPVRYLKGVGPKTAERFEKLGIVTLADLLCHYPRRYIDFTKPYSIAEAPTDVECVVRAEVFAKPGGRILPGGRRMERITAGDDVSSLEITWFNNPYAAQKLQLGQEYYFQGIVTGGMLRRQMVNPQVRTDAQVASSPFEAVYPQTEGLTSSAIAKCVRQLLPHVELLPDPLPPGMLKKYRLLPKADAVRAIHCPASEEEAFAARRRLIYEELLVLQLGIGRMKNHGAASTGAPMQKADASPFWDALPFSPTGAQRRAVEEILTDMAGETSMNRLLQGDVGSGKTLVALMAMLLAADNGFQACMMVPTEILARQHFVSITKMVEGVGVRVAVLTGSTKKRERDGILEELASGGLHILIGTHALIEERVKFDNLGLVVIDEQHRFGVEQRARMWTKNSRPPHVLVMTATPIPRTLAMTLYGDLDVSVIDELPPGRKPILTRHLYDSQRMKLFGFLRSEIARGRQVYVVYPLIKESEKMDYKDLYDGFETMSREFPLPQYRLSVVHGKLPAEEKEEGMRAFREGTTQIMVATSVIEVGVDVPNATVMVIESAERFGLSQLHQLRGRVGRGGEQSYCILMSGDRLSREARARLDAMVETNDGFRLSELDLKLRGAGDIGGTQQSGTAFELKIASLAKDAAVVEYARRAAEEILAADPSLTLPENALLARLKERYVNRGETDFGMIS
mgnify:CR=1 FL=1